VNVLIIGSKIDFSCYLVSKVTDNDSENITKLVDIDLKLYNKAFRVFDERFSAIQS
jgi:hypothetical protein